MSIVIFVPFLSCIETFVPFLSCISSVLRMLALTATMGLNSGEMTLNSFSETKTFLCLYTSSV